MKRFLLISLLSCLLGGMACAQDCDIHLMAIEANPDGEMPEAAGEYLFNRLCTAVTGDGISATGQYAQFFIAAKALPLYEQAVTGAPVKTALTLSLNLYIGDYWGEKVFDRMSLEIRGVGESRERAYLNAFRSLNKNNQQVANFLEKGKQRIIAYYDAEYNNIIREAQRESALRNYERALFLLGAVPVCCNGYDAVADELVKTYHEYIDYNCDRLLMQARNAWAVHPDQRGAAEAARILNQLEPDAACYGDAMDLYREIKDKMKDDWNFEMREKYKDSIELRKQTIEAARAVGVAFGEGQQPQTTNLMWMR
ncbi:MAG: hypothetical protein H9791_04780 [Candidatus Bacteroides intestinipullorum]|uniref:Tetratricopeptide repeat protein n=1 Tax=Candidatus Bacteroides intestinipullorum TaxID=2838471 RepID=A0A9E2KG67_9BACE|nr:hypothetical protein [Candidatus Bacteroides intestinipullorum]